MPSVATILAERANEAAQHAAELLAFANQAAAESAVLDALEVRVTAVEQAAPNSSATAISRVNLGNYQEVGHLICELIDPYPGGGGTLTPLIVPPQVAIEGLQIKRGEGDLSADTFYILTGTWSKPGQPDVPLRLVFHSYDGAAPVLDLWQGRPNPLANMMTPLGHDIVVLPGPQVARLHVRPIGKLNSSLTFFVSYKPLYYADGPTFRFQMLPDQGEQIIDLPVDLQVGAEVRIDVRAEGFSKVNATGDIFFPFNNYFIRCAATLGDYVEPETLVWTTHTPRRTADRTQVHTLSPNPEFANGMANERGSATGGSQGQPKYTTPDINNAHLGEERGVYTNSTHTPAATPFVNEDGRLKMQGERVAVEWKNFEYKFSSPNLWTRGVFQLLRGGCVKMTITPITPHDPTTCFAVWTLGENFHPNIGHFVTINGGEEFDLTEYLGGQNLNHVTTHFVAPGSQNAGNDGGYSASHKGQHSNVVPYSPLWQPGVPIVYELDISDNAAGESIVSILYDGVIVYQQRKHIVLPIFFIISTAIGGTLTGGNQPALNDSPEEPDPYIAWYVDEIAGFQDAAERAADGNIQTPIYVKPVIVDNDLPTTLPTGRPLDFTARYRRGGPNNLPALVGPWPSGTTIAKLNETAARIQMPAQPAIRTLNGIGYSVESSGAPTKTVTTDLAIIAALIASDDFDRTDVAPAVGALGSTPVGNRQHVGDAMGIMGGKAYFGSPSAQARDLFDVGLAEVDATFAFNANGSTVWCTIASTGGDQGVSLVVAASGASYVLSWRSGGPQFSAALPAITGDVSVRLKLVGTTLTISVNGNDWATQQLAADTLLGTLVAIVEENGTAARFDSIVVEAA